MTNHPLLHTLENFKGEVKRFLADKGVKVPADAYTKIENDKETYLFIKSIFRCVSASVGLDIREEIVGHFGIGFSLFYDDFELWTESDRINVKEALIKKVNKATLPVKKRELFFDEEVKTTAEQREEVLLMYKEIATIAITYSMGVAEGEKPSLQARAFELVLQLHDNPCTCLSDGDVSMRNLISLSRLEDITKKEIGTDSLAALKQVGRNWYQQSERNFLEKESGYHQYTYVKYYLYILTEEQLEILKEEFLSVVEDRYLRTKGEEWNRHTVGSIDYLLEQVNTILSWEVESI